MILAAGDHGQYRGKVKILQMEYAFASSGGCTRREFQCWGGDNGLTGSPEDSGIPQLR